MFGQNPIRPPKIDDGNILDIVDIFLTIQGEGPLAGRRAVFIRLGGCNLACSFCDTEFEEFYPQSIEKICRRVDKLGKAGDLIVITGGEPMRQNLRPLTDLLLQKYDIQIETNGTLFQELDRRVMFVCSPKNVSGIYAPIRPDLRDRINALKYIISASDKRYSDIGEVIEGVEVFIQPMDEYDEDKNIANMKHAIKLCLKKGYRMSIQMHKVLDIA